MRSTKFIQGDLVRLKDGGPPMTVWESGRRVLCSWYDVHGKATCGSFQPEELQLLSEPHDGWPAERAGQPET